MNPVFHKLAYWLDILDTCIIELPSALDFCYTAYRDDDDEPRKWTGVA